jgi:hypothetical protein
MVPPTGVIRLFAANPQNLRTFRKKYQCVGSGLLPLAVTLNTVRGTEWLDSARPISLPETVLTLHGFD